VQIEASFFFSVQDLSGSRSTSGADILPSSSVATHRRRRKHGLARVTREERGHRRWRGGGEERCSAVAVEREIERETERERERETR
jgi:hypothetical protein